LGCGISPLLNPPGPDVTFLGIEFKHKQVVSLGRQGVHVLLHLVKHDLSQPVFVLIFRLDAQPWHAHCLHFGGGQVLGVRKLVFGHNVESIPRLHENAFDLVCLLARGDSGVKQELLESSACEVGEMPLAVEHHQVVNPFDVK